MKTPACLIVGYGPGVGHGIAIAFGNAGYDPIVASRNPDKYAASVSELSKQGITVKSIEMDTADTASLRKAIESECETSDVQVLVYNAVVPTLVKPTQLDAEQLASDFGVNVIGALAATRAVLPNMTKHGEGCVLFTGGGWAHDPWDMAASPSIGNAGLRSLTMTLSQELSESPVRFGLVSITGQVVAGTAFDPAKIRAAFLALATRPNEGYETEIMFTGE